MWKFLNCLMNTMQCGRLVVMLLLCGVVLGEHLLECDGVFNNQYCWNSSTYLDDYCWRCEITLNKEISDTDQMITIYSKHDDGTDAAIDTVLVYGESVTKMPNIFLKTTKKPIKDVHLRETNTKLLNAQFFGNSGIYLKTFSYQLNELSVEASAFQNCTNLEELNFIQNNISSISPDAFLGLHKLIKLNVVFSDLAVVLKDWFKDLGNLEELVLSVNQLQEVPDNCFDTLIKLKTLDLSENKIEIIRWNNFQMNEQLEKINLEYNEIKDIQMGSFEHLSKLTWLDLKLNSCVDFDFVNNTSAEIAERLTACYPTRCRIPRISNGQVVSTQDNSTQAPGVSFNPYKSVTVVCHPTFIQFHEKETQPSNLCLKDDWKSQEWPECHRVCPHDEIKGISIIAFCRRHGKEFPCSGHLLPGTKATIRCHFGYVEPTTEFNSELICLESGEWSHPVHQCEPDCGIVTIHSSPLLIRGKNTNVTEVPWHVGIYQNGEQICGGTIVTERVVISAAHCFSMNTKQIHVFDVKDFSVAAGKIRRGLVETKSQETQMRFVQKVKISDRYDGSNTWWADIATIIIEGHFDYQPHVSPACLKFTNDSLEKYPSNGTKALVAGWGLNKVDISSDILQSFEIPVLDLETCKAKAPEDFMKKVIADKICAGSISSSQSYSMVVCPGDSGGGLLIPQIIDRIKRYCLQGVVSNSRRTLDCDRTFYTLFTNVQHYKDFIQQAIYNFSNN